MPKGFQLAIESSGAGGSVAVGCGKEVISSEDFEAGQRPSEVLTGHIQKALRQIGKASIELVLIGTGPGSYNGARVGIATGQGVALVHGCPAVGLCSLEAVPAVRAGHNCVALGDARRGTYFTAMLRNGKLSGKVDLLDYQDFLQRVKEAAEAGTGLLTLEDPSRLKLADVEVEVELAVPSASLLLEAWWAKSESEREVLRQTPPEPFYLRPPHITKPK